MKNLSPRSDALSAAGRAVHDVGLSALLGGNLFGHVAMHPALQRVSDKSERGEVLNTAWRRYGTVNAIGLASIIAGWGGARSYETRDRFLSPRERALAQARDIAVGAVTVTGVATALAGMRFNSFAPGGAVPLKSGSATAPETPPAAARVKRAVNAVSALNLVSEVALVGINSALAQENFRRPPLRRFLKRRWG